jgi:hypothetical protein
MEDIGTTLPGDLGRMVIPLLVGLPGKLFNEAK